MSRVFRRFLEKPLRRSPTEARVQSYFLQSTKGTLKRTMRPAALLSTYREILCSRQFFLSRRSPAISLAKPKRTTSWREARLLFLWCSVPDDQLLRAGVCWGIDPTPSVLAVPCRAYAPATRKSSRWVPNSCPTQCFQTFEAV